MPRKAMPKAAAGVRLPSLPPEIWHMVCSYLDTADVPSFRQTCQGFAHLGQPFALPEIVLYLHQSDFKNLRVLADHPVKSKYVRSLIFVPHTLPDPKLTFDQFVRKYHHREKINMFTNTASRYGGHSTRPFNRRQLREYYAAYEDALRQQTEILQQHLDFACLADVLPKLTNLRKIMVSVGNWHRERLPDSASDPFNGTMQRPFSYLQPSGYRAMVAVVDGLKGCESKLSSFEGGTFSWKFVEQLPPPDLFSSLTNLAFDFEVHELDPDPNFYVPDTGVPECRALLARGGLRDFLAGLPCLESLSISFMLNADTMDIDYPARLEDIIKADHRWPRLRSLSLGDIEVKTQEIIDTLTLHQDTLRRLELHDIRLSTSWLTFLPEVSELLELDEASIWGDIYGARQPVLGPGLVWVEHWDMGEPHLWPDDSFRTDLGAYLVNGGTCPLNHHNQGTRLSPGYDPFSLGLASLLGLGNLF